MMDADADADNWRLGVLLGALASTELSVCYVGGFALRGNIWRGWCVPLTVPLIVLPPLLRNYKTGYQWHLAIEIKLERCLRCFLGLLRRRSTVNTPCLYGYIHC